MVFVSFTFWLTILKLYLESVDKFESPVYFRSSKNRLKYLPVFNDNVTKELIIYGPILYMIPGASIVNNSHAIFIPVNPELENGIPNGTSEKWSLTVGDCTSAKF